MRKLLSLLAGAVLAAAVQAQACSTLTITGSGAAGSDLTFALQGDPSALGLLAVGETTGSTTIHFGPIATLDLGLAQPFILLPIGRTDQNGDVTLTVTLPNNVPSLDLNGQGMTVTFSFRPLSIAFCTSDVVAFHIGT
jgi:hypothetical protein